MAVPLGQLQGKARDEWIAGAYQLCGTGVPRKECTACARPLNPRRGDTEKEQAEGAAQQQGVRQVSSDTTLYIWFSIPICTHQRTSNQQSNSPGRPRDQQSLSYYMHCCKAVHKPVLQWGRNNARQRRDKRLQHQSEVENGPKGWRTRDKPGSGVRSCLALLRHANQGMHLDENAVEQQQLALCERLLAPRCSSSARPNAGFPVNKPGASSHAVACPGI